MTDVLPKWSPEDAQRVLEDRARALARPLESGRRGNRFAGVTFLLAGERYAIESRYVHEVFRLRDLSLLPGAQSPVIGVTAWRGRLLTVLDVRPQLGLPATALNDLGRVIAVGNDAATGGILVDAVEGLLDVAVEEIREPPEGVATHRALLRGITGDAVLVLDAGALLARLADDRTPNATIGGA